MAITSSQILYELTGGASNTDPDASLGGVNSGNTFSGALHTLFDAVGAQEAADGDVEYRAIDIKNNHGTLTLTDAQIWLSVDSTGANDVIAIGYDSGTQTIADEDTAPNSPTITFSSPTSKAASSVLAASTDLAPAGTVRIWVRRTATAGATVRQSTVTLKVEGDTGP